MVDAKIVLHREIFNTINILALASQYFQYWYVLYTIWKASGTNSGW